MATSNCSLRRSCRSFSAAEPPDGQPCVHRCHGRVSAKPTQRTRIIIASKPEAYYVTEPTRYVPNSPLPVLIYRRVLPGQPTVASISDTIEQNHWRQGGVFKTYTAHHFHSETHECYAVFKGSSRLLLGRGPLDEAEGGIEVDLGVGDIIVLPAGVSHYSLTSEGDYEYVGLYPEGSPKWDNNFCKADEVETQSKASRCRQVPIPDYDPIFGVGGPLCEIWGNAVDRGHH